MNEENLRLEYQDKQTVFNELQNEVEFILSNTLHKHHINHTIYKRVKTWESFLDKTQRKELSNPFLDIHDIVGLRIVCLFLSDIERIRDLIENSFDVISRDNKIDGYDAASFGYMSIHFIAILRDTCRGPRYDDLQGQCFEIQIRTIAMDAWANISHNLDYKSESDIPKDLKRDFYAISGLFYVADKHFELFFKASQKSQNDMKRLSNQASDLMNCEINLDSLTAYLSKRLPDRRHAEPKRISQLVSEVLNKGYKQIKDLDIVLNENWDDFIECEKAFPPSGTGIYADIGVIREIIHRSKTKL